MNGYRDPELDDVLQDDELRHVATLLGSARAFEAPLDEAYRTGLRRQLMQQAWAMTEGRDSWWRRILAPPGLAWVGATAGVLLIASVVIFVATQPPVGPFQLTVRSDLDGSRTVALQQPILVAFNQPMDHQSTEQAVQIAPATNVSFSWESNTLAVLPQNGNLAPNTQYQVTIGPGAKTATGQRLSAPQTITFVTQPPPTPAPTPSPRPTPTSNSLLTGEKQLAPLNGGSTTSVQWAADSSAVYFVDGKGALSVIPAKGGDTTAIAPDGASSPSISPAGDRLAYIRSGKIEVLTFAAGKTEELTVTPAPTLVGWGPTGLIWTTGDGVYTQTDSVARGQRKVAAFPLIGVVSPLSISPDGTHVAFTQDQNLFTLDLSTGRNNQLGAAGAIFDGWSPGGSFALYGNASGLVVSDQQGNTQTTLPSGDASWSSQDAVLLGSDTDLSQIRPDGSGLTRLANGTYHAPAWAPDGASFVFVRGGALWVAAAPALAPEPTALDQAALLITAFMDSRLKNQDQAATFLDANGKQAFASSGMHLTITGDPRFTRYYVVTKEAVSTHPDTTRFVVRLVLTHGRIDVTDYEETLTLVRDSTTGRFLVDQATAGPHRDLGKGAEVVGVDIAADVIRITFDSDLDPATVSDGVVLLDDRGRQVNVTIAYTSRIVTITGLDLKPEARYRLVVLSSVRDVSGHNVASEYDLDLVGPAAKKKPELRPAGKPTPSPVATPTAVSGG